MPTNSRKSVATAPKATTPEPTKTTETASATTAKPASRTVPPDATPYPTSRVRGEYRAKETGPKRLVYRLRRKGESQVVGELVREGTRWFVVPPGADRIGPFPELDAALDKVNELRL